MAPIASEESAGPTVNDWTSVALLGNDILMQWYAATHDKPITPLVPTQPYPTSSQIANTTTLLIIGAVIVAVVVFSNK
jgi:hypothetical protein